MFLQFVYWLQLSYLLLTCDLSLITFLISGLHKLFNPWTSAFRLHAHPETVVYGTSQLHDCPSVHWKHTIPACVWNTWTATEGWRSTWAEAPVQNPFISENRKTRSMCQLAEAWLITVTGYSSATRLGILEIWKAWKAWKWRVSGQRLQLMCCACLLS